MFFRALAAAIGVLIFCAAGFSQEMKMLNIGLNSAGDLLIISPDGKRIGYDPAAKKNYEEIKGASASTSRNREPIYRVPVGDPAKDITIRIFGRVKQTRGDLGISGEGFTIRAIGLPLEPKKNFTLIFRPDLGKFQFSGNTMIENPAFNFAIDPPDAMQPSYIFKLGRSKLPLKKAISIGLDLAAGIFSFSDNGTPKDTYSLRVTQIAPNGNEKEFSNDKIASAKANRFQYDFKKLNCILIDENANGFADEKCEK